MISQRNLPCEQEIGLNGACQLQTLLPLADSRKWLLRLAPRELYAQSPSAIGDFLNRSPNRGCSQMCLRRRCRRLKVAVECCVEGALPRHSENHRGGPSCVPVTLPTSDLNSRRIHDSKLAPVWNVYSDSLTLCLWLTIQLLIRLHIFKFSCTPRIFMFRCLC